MAGLLDRDSRHRELGCWCRWVRGQEVTRLGQGPEVAVRLWALWDAQVRAPRAHLGPTAMSLTAGMTLESERQVPSSCRVSAPSAGKADPCADGSRSCFPEFLPGAVTEWSEGWVRSREVGLSGGQFQGQLGSDIGVEP